MADAIYAMSLPARIDMLLLHACRHLEVNVKINRNISMNSPKESTDNQSNSSNEIDKLRDVLMYGMCRCNVNAGTEEHSCPYDEDVNNNPDSACNCCNQCCRSCADDI